MRFAFDVIRCFAESRVAEAGPPRTAGASRLSAEEEWSCCAAEWPLRRCVAVPTDRAPLSVSCA